MPYFRGTKKQKITDTNVQPASSSNGQRVTMRGECIEQLGKWHSLLEKGAITQADYDERKDVIMNMKP